MTKERPILFSGPMVQALLADKKTQTRRVVKPQPFSVEYTTDGKPFGWYDWIGHEGRPLVNRYGQPGDHLWIRETFVIESNADIESADAYPPPFTDGRPTAWHEDDGALVWQQCHYRATDPTPALHYDDADEPTCRWKPSIFMPRWASRITLEVTDVRCERLGDITEADAEAEGIAPLFDAETIRTTVGLEPYRFGARVPWTNYLWHGRGGGEGYSSALDARDSYRSLWDSINGRKHPWSSSPWVWVLTFKRVADRRDATTSDRHD